MAFLSGATSQLNTQKQPTSVPQGMFGDTGGGGTSWYSPTTNFQQWKDRQYDISGISSGANMLKNLKPLETQKYNAFQFNTPQYGNIGAYGMTSPQDYQNLYQSSLEAASAPIRKQGAEAMRGLGQGFEGGRMTGPAARELAMKQAMGTGANIQDVAKNLSQNMLQNQLGERQTARQAEWGQKADIAKSLFSAEQQRQLQQAQENFQSAGFNASQAQNMSTDAMARAQMMLNFGFQLPQFQMGLNQAGLQPFSNMFNLLQGQAQSAAQAPTASGDKRPNT